MENNSLVIFTKAEQMLAEAVTIQQAKELKDLALTAADWARRKDMGEKAINHARGYAFEAERKMGEMLICSDRHPPGIKTEVRFPQGTELPPTLTELGLTKKESSRAQELAELPEDIFEDLRAGETNRKTAKKKKKAREIKGQRAEIALAAEGVMPSERWDVCLADIHTWSTPKKYDFIITDPPYPKEFIPLYEVLSKRSEEWLLPGGLLIAMCGQSYVDEIYQRLNKHLDYYWTAAYLTPGQPTPLRQRNVNTTWKPLLIFSKGEYKGKIFGDVFKSDGNDKSYHKWGQSISGMCSIISGICLAGQSILDPFCGAGTTGLAALMHGCLFDGIDTDEENQKIAIARLSEYDTKER